MEKKKNYFEEFEIVKALAIMGLPFVHFIEEAGYEFGYIAGYNERFFDNVIFLTVFGPAIFMMCMGARIRKEYSSKRLITNGIQFLIIGYMLNFVCFSVPRFIYALMNGVMSDGENLINTGLMDWFGGDIYVFVGWFYLFYGMLKKHFRNITTFQMICICSVMLVINNFQGHRVELPYNVATQLLGNFVTVNDHSYFPLAGWSIFVVAGMAIRDYLSENDFKSYHQHMTYLLILGAGGLWLLHSALDVYEIETIDILINFTQNYTLDIFTAFTLLLLSMAVLSIVSKVYHAVRRNLLEKFLIQLSTLIMAYYIFQWMLVALTTYYGLYLLHNVESCIPLTLAIGIMFLIWAASLFLTLHYGFPFLNFILKKTDYTRWFKHKNKRIVGSDHE